MAVAAVDKALLKDRAYSEIKRFIQSDEFSPGEFLSERKLANRLGMSKTPVKAALERLETEGFVAVSPQQGIVVRDLSIHEIADLFEIRLALETFVLQNIAGKVTSGQAGQIRKNLREQSQAAKDADLNLATRLDSEFHSLFCEFLGNREILRVMLQLREKMHRVVNRVFENIPERLQLAYREHRVIARAVLDGDADRAVASLEEHLNCGKQLLLSPRR
jgi:DNA-binding GntR family transcriptional regulator